MGIRSSQSENGGAPSVSAGVTKGAALRAAWELYAECQNAHARKRSSSAPPCRTELSWASAPLMLATIVARPSGPSAAMAVCVQPDHEVPKEPTVPFAHSWRWIHAMVSAPSSASGTRKLTSPSERKQPRQSWLTTT